MKLKILIAFTGLFLFASDKIFSQNCSVNAGVATTVCGNSTMLLTGNKNGLFASGNLSVWSQVSGPSVTILNASSNGSVPGTHFATVTGFSAGNTYTFRITGSCQDGTSSTQTVSYAVKSVTSANAGPDQTVCPGIAGPNSLAGNAVAAGETGAWSGSNANSPVTAVQFPNSPTSTFTAPLIGTNSPTLNNSAGTRTLTWTITNSNGCTSSDQVVITNMSGVATVSGGADQILSNCYTTTQSTTMAASFNGNGTGGQGGVWTVINGPSIPTITSVISNITTVNNLIQGVYTLRWTVSGPCVNGYDDVIITVPAPTQSITNVGNSITNIYCDGRTEVVLARPTPAYSNEVATWTTVSGPGGVNITNPNSPTASITGLNGSSAYQFKYAIVNTVTGCTTSNTIDVKYANSAPIITTGITSTILGCNQTSVSIPYTVTILGSNPSLSTQYQIVSGPRTTSLANVSTTPQNVSGMTIPGTYTIRLTSIAVTNANNNTFVYGTCPAGTQDVTATASVSPTTANAGSQPAVACNVFSVGLSGNNPTVGTGVWSQVSGPNTSTILNSSSATANTVTGMVNGTYVFRWLITGGPACGSSQSDVIVKVANTIPGAAAVGFDQSVCNSTPVFLTGSAPGLGETGTWSATPTIPAANFYPSANTANVSIPGLSSGTTYTFRWTISNACASGFADTHVAVSTTAGPSQAIAGPDICRIGAFTTATMAGNTPAPAGATGQWTQITGPTTAAFADNTSATTSVTGLTNGSYTFEWALSRGGCAPSRDTVGVTIALLSVAGANAGSDISLCGSSTQLLGNNISTVTGTWSQVSGTGGAIISNANLYNTSISGLTSGSYVYRWTLSNGVCPTTFDDVSINVSTQSATASVGSNITLCGVTLTTLSGNVISGGSGIWSTVGSAPGIAAFSNVISPNATVSGLLTGSYTFRWTASGGPYCSSTSADIVVNVAANANAGVDQSLCNATLFALNGNSGTTGVWSQVSGPSSTLTSVSGTSANALGSSSGIYTYRYTANSVFGCASTFDDMVVTASGLGSTPDAGSDQNLCNTTITGLSGNTPGFGTGAWSIVTFPGYTAGATILGANLPNATLSGISPGVLGTTVSGTYILQWTISNGSCSSYSDIARITSYKTPSTAIAGSDQLNGCSSSTTLAGNNPSVGLGVWTQIAGPNTATITSPILNNSSVTNLTLGGYTFQWTISNGTVCGTSTSQVGVTITGLPPTIANAGADQALCNASVTTLAGNNPSSGTGSWSVISGPNIPVFVNSLSGITSLTGMVAGTYVLQWTTAYNSCTSSDQVQIVNSALPTTANISSANFSVCPYVIPTVTGNAALSGTGLWSKTSGSGTAVFNAPNATVTSVYGLSPGSYTFQWSITSGSCPSSIANINVTILGNCPPVASNLTFTGLEDITLNGTITGFSDPDGIIPTITGGTFTSTNGRPLTITGINTATGIARVTYSPALDYFGTDTYTYQVCDQLVCTTAVITFSITGVNDAPVVRNITTTGINNTLLATSLTGIVYSTVPGAVYDVDNAVVTINSGLVYASSGLLTSVTGKGTVSITGAGLVYFSPATTFAGIYNYSLQVCDLYTCTSGVITFVVTNQPPVVKNITFTGGGSLITGSLTGINGSTVPGSVWDADNTPVTINGILGFPSGGTLTNTASQGTVSITGGGNVFFQPAATFTGIYNFPVSVCDPITCTSGIITFIRTNQPPVATSVGVSMNEDSGTITGIINSADPDGQIVTFGAGTTTNSTGTFILTTAGGYSFTPAANYNGITVFTAQFCDPIPACASATVTITVVGVPDYPVAVTDNYTTNEDTPLTSVNVLSNDLNPLTGNNTGLTVTGFTGTITGGSLTLTGIGALTFVPFANYNGITSTSYTVCNIDGCTTGGINITVVGVPDYPVAVTDNYSTNEDTPLTSVNVLSNDLNPLTGNNTGLTVTGFTGTITGGSLTLTGAGALTFVPLANYNGITSTNYTVCNIDGCTTGGINITIVGVNDPPVAVNLTFTGLEDMAINQTISGFSDIDTPTSSLVVQLVSTTGQGSLTVSGTGAFTYLPNANYNGLDSFTYVVSDGSTISGIATVTLSIVGVNDPPVAVNLTFTGLEDMAINQTISGFSDIDTPTSSLVVQLVSTTGQGSLTVSGTGAFTYLPNANYNGLDSFTYVVSDGSTVSGIATVTLSIVGVNDPPVAVNLTFTGLEDTAINQTISGFSDIDTPTSSLVVQLVSTTGQGSLTVSGTGAFTYLPNANYNGLDSFTYVVSDGSTVSGIATVTLSIVGVNDPPVAVNLTFTGLEDTAINQTISGFSDIDTPASSLVVQLVSTTGQGSLTVSGTGAFTYLPNANYNGLDSFTYVVSDGSTISGIATVTLSIVGVNDPPVAVNLTFTGLEDTAINQTISGFSDIDTPTSSLVVQLVSTTGQGSLTVSGTGAFTYLPNANYNGLDSFTYVVSDGSTISGIATVTLSIVGVNDPPVAVNLTFTGLEDTAINQTITGFSDIDTPASSLVVQLISTTGQGSLTVSGTGAFTYLPNANYNGLDSFTYVVSDGSTVSGIATVTLSIVGVNDPPVAVNLTFTGLEDTAINQTISGFSDIDTPASSLVVQLVSTTGQGSLTVSGTGAFTYLPNANYNGLDSFTYVVSDGSTVSGIATVTLSIVGVNDPPVAVNLTFTGLEDTAINQTITGFSDIDTPTSSLVVQLVSTTGQGSLTVSGTGAFTYLPNANYNGLDSFTYVVSDGSTVSGIATVTLSIVGVNDPPTAIDLGFTGLEDTAISTSITGWNDVDGDLVTVSITGMASNGTITGAGFDLTYTPNANYNGIDSYTYLVQDPGGLVSSIQTVTITVIGVNDPPTAIDLGFTGLEDTAIPTSITGWNDVDGDLVTVSITGVASNGTVTGIGFDWTYMPNANYNGIDSYTYLVQDPGGLVSSIQTVTITVIGVNDPPLASNLTFTGIKNNLLAGSITGFSDPDGTIPTVTGGVFGSFTISGTTVSFMPPFNYVGITTLGYNVCDDLTCTSAIITFKITNTNSAPTAIDLGFTGLEDTAIPTSITGWNDIDGDLVTVSITGMASNGTVTGAGFDWTYTPNANYNGIDTYTYLVQDPGGLVSSIQTVTITVVGVPDYPVALTDNYTINEDSPLTGVNVLSNDLNPLTGDNTGLTVTGFTGAITGGSLTLTGSGALTFVPSVNYNGITSTNYTVCNVDGCTTAGINITVVGVPDYPVALTDNYTTNEDTPLTGVNILSNDLNPLTGDNTGLTVTGFTGAIAGGSLTLTGSGALTFVPSANYNGITSTNYTVCNIDGCTTAGINITVVGVPDYPVALTDNYTTNEDTPLTGVNVLSNDLNPLTGDNTGLTVTGFTGAITGGSLTLTGSGALTFVPNANYNGITSTNYTVCNIDGCTTAGINITVVGVPDYPVALTDNYTTNEDSPLTGVNILSNDLNPLTGDNTGLTVTGFTGAITGGSLTLTGSGALTFVPNANYNGITSTSYTVCNIDGCTTAGINITVVGVPDYPAALADNYTINEDSPLTGVNVLSNDLNPLTGDNTGLTVTGFTGAITGGSLTLTGSGALTFVPSANYNGITSTSYTVCNVDGCTTAGINITVVGVPDYPVALTDNYTINEDSPLTGVNVLSNDLNPLTGDNTGLTVTGFTGAITGGSLTLTGSGALTFVPSANYNGITSTSYTVCNTDGCTTAGINITVVGVNHPPVASNLTFSGIKNSVITGSVTGFSDPDGTVPSVTGNVFTTTKGGLVTVSGTIVTYIPNATFTGTDVFNYSVCDAAPLCTTATITIIVNTTAGTNTPPLVNNDTASTVEKAPVDICVLCNDSDPDGSLVITTLTVTSGIPATTGSLQINTVTGKITYTPNNTFTGIATFVYSVCDNGPSPVQCNNAMVTITVIPREILVTASAVCIKDAAYVNYSVTATNFDPTGLPLAMTWLDTLGNTVTVVSNLSLNGSVLWPGAVVDASGNGVDWPGWIKDADGNWIQGNDGFQSLRPKVEVLFKVNPTYTLILNYPPPTALCNTNPPSTVGVHQPYAPSLTVTGLEDHIITGAIAGISDLDGTVPVVNANVFTITGGVLTLTGTGAYVFAPAPNYNGVTSMLYTVCDAVSSCTSGMITFSIIGVNDPPVAVNDSIATNEDATVSFSILGNDFDVDGSLVTASIDLDPSTPAIDVYYTSNDGVYTVNTATGIVTFVPKAGFIGVAATTYVVYDNEGAVSDVATIKINVIIVTSDPVLPPGTYVPGGFSPNGDGTNDNFFIESNGYKVKLHVYNRWGNVIYQSDDYKNDWGGDASWGLVIKQATDKAVPDGTYFCVIDFVDSGHKSVIKSITISR